MSNSELPKIYDPKAAEARHYPRWEADKNLYVADPNAPGEKYAIMMPPPNVTGSLHMGHALNATLHDILIRAARMQGKNVLWLPGTDHASIAVHMVLERQLAEEGKTKHDLGREKFLERAWEWKKYSGDTIMSQLRRLGALPDWSRERFTMDEGLSAAVNTAFVRMYNDGLIYRAKRMVNWDPKMQTSVSDVEIVHRDIEGKMYHFRYPFADGTGYIAIATTRPETILADGAVAVHPDDERYKQFVGKFLHLPIVNRMLPIVADTYVEQDFGSGAVKITAAHDFNDFQLAQRHPDANIPYINLMTTDGRMNENCPPEYRGLDRYEAREKVVAEFEALGLLDKIEPLKHTVPYSERGGVPVEPMLTDQWWVKTDELAARAIKAVETGETKFVPKNWENTFFEWLRNIQPWCISRQLWWGHQIPAWYDDAGNIYVAETEEEALQQYYASSPSRGEVALRSKDGRGEKDSQNTPSVAQARQLSPQGGANPLRRDDDVFDTWFSSGLWPFSTLGWPDKTADLAAYYPGAVLITGFDIIFFWVARMMMMGIYFMGEVPFKDVYMHALVRDATGAKMSKSKGNVIDPLALIDDYGADALRFTLTAMAAQGRDIKLSPQRVEGYRNFATKLWNASRFSQMNGAKYDAAFDPASAKEPINQWIIDRTVQLAETVTAALHEYKFNDAANALYQFIWGQFCDWYVELSKPLLQTEGHTAQAETRATLMWSLSQALHLLHPFMPFLTEELWAQLFDGSSLLASKKWPALPQSLKNPAAREKIETIIAVISGIRAARQALNVPASVQIPLRIVGASPALQTELTAATPMIQRMARIADVTFDAAAPKHGEAQIALGDAMLLLPLEGVIDFAAESARLTKQADRLSKEIAGLEARLGNSDFVAGAPEEIIEEQREKLSAAKDNRTKIQQAIAQITGQ